MKVTGGPDGFVTPLGFRIFLISFTPQSPKRFVMSVIKITAQSSKRHKTVQCPSVCPSFRLSVRPSHAMYQLFLWQMGRRCVCVLANLE